MFWMNLKTFLINGMDKINIQDKFSLFTEHYSPKLIGEVNGTAVKLVRVLGDFVWHKHDNEDEMFLVIEGSMRMDYRNKQIILNEGELVIVPKGVEHKPYAENECKIMLIEPKETLNTGGERNEFTVETPERI